MQFINLLLLLVSFRITPGSSSNARSLIPVRLQQSPFGIGVRNGLSRASLVDATRRASKNTRIVRQCRQSDDDLTRHAVVFQEEALALRRTLLPHLRQAKVLQYPTGDELDWLEGDATPCAKLTTKTISPRASLAIQSVQDRFVKTSTGSDIASNHLSPSDTRGGGVLLHRPLVFWENMICGAVSRSIAQTVMHPANTMKTILQSTRGANRPTLSQLMRPDQFRMLTRGAGANFLLSVPHGAVNFAVLEFVRGKLTRAAQTVPFLRERLDSFGPALDFSSSAISTICCSIVSTPQMMITDNIMAGNYPNLASAISGLYKDNGIIGFYRGWFPGLVGKIPSYVSTA